MSKKIPAIGIDLGTTYSVIGAWMNGDVKILQNDEGQTTTPSIISFLDEELFGESAKVELIRNPKNTIFNVKRLIGRKITDESVKEDMKNLPYTIKGDNEDRIQIEVTYNNTTKKFYPEEISAKILQKMKEIGESNINKDLTSKDKKIINDVVITVPAYFNSVQTKATQQSAKIAGLNPIRIIHEPTAAAIAYGLNKKMKEDDEEYVIVFDLGGGTFDVSILCLEKDSFEVIATNGDCHLGGEDFDNELVKLCVKKFKENEEIDLNQDKYKKKLLRLKTHCEKAKRILSNSIETTIYIDGFINEKDLEIKISRQEFEEVCKDHFKKCIDIVKDCLNNKKVQNKKISELLFVGGSSRIPKLKEMMKEIFPNTNVNSSINPDEVVAYGAAVQAAILTDKYNEKLEDLILIDVNPLSLSTGLYSGKSSVIIKKHSNLPIKKTRSYFTVVDNQKTMNIDVYEGESEEYKLNHKLGEFNLENLPKGKAGEVKVDITFEIDENSILHVTAKEVSSGTPKTMKIINDTGNLTEREIESIMRLDTNENELTDEIRTEIYQSEHPEKKINIHKDIKELRKALLDSSNELDRMNISNKLEIAYEAYLKSINDNDLENSFVLEKFQDYFLSLINCYGNSLSSSIYINDSYIEKVNKSLNHYLTLLNKHSQIIPLSYINSLEINKDVYSKSAFLIITFHCERINECIKSRKNLLENKSILEFDLQKLSIKQLNFPPEIKDQIILLLNHIKFLFRIKEGDELLEKAINNNDDENLLFSSMDIYRTCLIEIQNQNNIEFEALCLAKLAQSFRKTKIYPVKKILDLCNRVEELIKDVLYKDNLYQEDWYQKNSELRDKLLEEQGKMENSEFSENFKSTHPEIFKELDDAFKKSRKEFFTLITTKYPFKDFNEKQFKKDLKKKKVGEKYFNAKYKLDKLPENNLKEKEYKTIIREILSYCNNLEDSPNDLNEGDSDVDTDEEV